jgi:hypothetical protein
MIKELRQYIREQIASIDSDLIENESAFYDGDIGETTLENTYQIAINNIQNQLRTDYREDALELIVSIFGFGYRNEIEAYDELLDKALCIRDNIIEIANFSGVANIVNIESIGIVSTQLPGDDNGFKIDINLTVRHAYS